MLHIAVYAICKNEANTIARWLRAVADAPLTADQRADWATYRQALRDLPGVTTDPALVVWPTPPASD